MLVVSVPALAQQRRTSGKLGDAWTKSAVVGAPASGTLPSNGESLPLSTPPSLDPKAPALSAANDPQAAPKARTPPAERSKPAQEAPAEPREQKKACPIVARACWSAPRPDATRLRQRARSRMLRNREDRRGVRAQHGHDGDVERAP